MPGICRGAGVGRFGTANAAPRKTKTPGRMPRGIPDFQISSSNCRRIAGLFAEPVFRSGPVALEQTFALRLLACELARTADRFGLLTGAFFGRFLEMLLELHFAEHAFALELFLQRAERLVDIVVTNTDLHVVGTTFLETELQGNLQELAF